MRIALWIGGAISIGAGLLARREMLRAHRKREHEEPDDAPEQARESA